MEKITIRQATEKWVSTFNAYPQGLLELAYPNGEGYRKLNPPKYVCLSCSKEYQPSEAEEIDYLCSCNEPAELEEWKKELLDQDEDHFEDMDEEEIADEYQEYITDQQEYLNEEEDYGYGLPSWGTLWSFGSTFCEEWLLDNLEEVSRIGFVVFESDEIGIFIGIDGGGYNFYDAHWIPLYKAMGMKWHTEEI